MFTFDLGEGGYGQEKITSPVLPDPFLAISTYGSDYLVFIPKNQEDRKCFWLASL